VERIYLQPTNLGVYTYAKPRFWRRQFDDATTRAQLRFDIAFGLVIPVLCFVFDPVVFRGWLIGEGIYARFQFFAYAASAVELTTLACWLFVVRKFPAWSRPAGGVMLAGTLFSFTLGVAILPFSLFGLMFVGLGALGFIPFVTAFVYLRNGLRALRLNRSAAPVRGAAYASFVFGAVVALGIPAAAQVGVERVVETASAEVIAGGEVSPAHARALRAISRFSRSSFDEIVWEYNRESDPTRKAHLAKSYAELTGRDIEASYERMSD
jgi:hypothetical protein